LAENHVNICRINFVVLALSTKMGRARRKNYGADSEVAVESVSGHTTSEVSTIKGKS